jgi:hypothetical protein
MKSARLLSAALAAAACIPLMAQQPGATGQQESSSDATTNANPDGAQSGGSAKQVYANQGPMGFGDASASHAWEMSTVTCDLENKLDSKTAKVGDRVVLRTADKVQTADGTVMPRGTRVVGHITQVQIRDATHGTAQLAIAFDHVELKNGQSIAIYTLIRGVFPMSTTRELNPLNNTDPMTSMNSPTNGGGRSGRNGGGQSGILGDTVQRTPSTTTAVEDRAGANTDPNASGAVELAGHGDQNESTGAHQQAAARALPRPTAIPGILLAGSSTASGVFLAPRGDIAFESGIEMQLGIIAKE